MTARMEVDWLAIEGEYRAGQKPVTAIAKEHGVSEGTIRARAKKKGWARDPAATQREKVKAHFAGITNGVTHGVTNDAVRKIEESAQRAIAIEELALSNAELALVRIKSALESAINLDSGEIKRLSEANRINLDTARTIFSLDETAERPGVRYDDAPFPHPPA